MKCPNCNKEWIAEILWGYPADIESVKVELERKDIILGGCLVTEHDPKWECNDCHHRWGYADHNDENKADSFDYDKGFNIKEVYDQ
ncbi:MAG: hypothetical protein OPY07_01850 [Nitrosopumilus sp.]|nr:hypothetical protein [Nitrosopumilus sp.]MDF2429665.1 hypothetical protein [Nitrosopumilus sp.]